jgi:hypothetical protein
MITYKLTSKLTEEVVLSHSQLMVSSKMMKMRDRKQRRGRCWGKDSCRGRSMIWKIQFKGCRKGSLGSKASMISISWRRTIKRRDKSWGTQRQDSLCSWLGSIKSVLGCSLRKYSSKWKKTGITSSWVRSKQELEVWSWGLGLGSISVSRAAL